MTATRRTVLIPLGSASSAKARIAYVHADASKPANEAKLVPQIALLNDCRLYPAGTVALAAQRKLNLSPRGLSLSKLFGNGSAPAYLSVSNASDLAGLSPENSASAQLGLLAALLMHQAQSKDWIVVATGRLGVDETPFGAPGSSATDVVVQPVGLLDQKIEAVKRLLDDYRGTAMKGGLHFFFPAKTETGEETLKAYADSFFDLDAHYRERGLTLRLCPVSTVRDFLRSLDIVFLRRSLTDKVALAALALALLGSSAGAAAYGWISRPLALDFKSLRPASDESLRTPLRAARSKVSGDLEVRPHCLDRNGMPIYGAGEKLLLHAGIRSAGAFTQRLGGYRFAIVTISEKSGVKVFPPEAWRRDSTTSSDGVMVVVPVEAPAEENKLILLARPILAFDTAALRQTIEAAIAGRPEAERINAAVNALVKEAPGYLDYSFATIQGEPECRS